MCSLALLFGSCCPCSRNKHVTLGELKYSSGCTQTKSKFLSIRPTNCLSCFVLLFLFFFSDMSFNVLIHLEEETFHNATSVTTL